MNESIKTRSNGQSPAAPPETEVVAPAKRRRHTVAYKRRIVKEAENCTERGSIGALLRREGLYSSQLTTWRRQYAAGTLGDNKRGRPADPQTQELTQLKRENEHLRQELEKAQLIMEAQKKLSELLGLSLSSETGKNSNA